MINTLIKILVMTVFAAGAGVAVAAPAAPIPAKQRIEREFRMLETALARCMYEEVIPSPDIEFMNRAIYDFMRDNPGVTRIMRVNAGGFTVNDVTPESPRSAPPRNVSGQRWFQHISQGKAPYYSMDVTPDGTITLFYAWPLTASAGGSETAVTGGFAASIDLVSQIALIDDAPPFRILYGGKAIFEHDWDDLDYDTEPLPVRGARDVMIQTPKPMQTRLDQRAPSKSGGASASKRASDARSDADDDDEGRYSAKPGKKKADTISRYMNIALFVLLLLIALMLGYSIFNEKISRAVRAWNDTRSMKALRSSTTTAMPAVSDTSLSLPATTPTALPPQPVVTKIISSERAEKVEKLYKEQQKTIAKMAELIHKKIDVMEKKMDTLGRRMDAWEKEMKKINVMESRVETLAKRMDAWEREIKKN